MRKEGSPTTLGKAPNPTTLRIFFPVRQNDDVPKKGTRLDSPQARPSAKQTKEQASARPRSVPGQGASKRQSKQEKAPLQGGLYSRHCSQRREPNNVRESSKPDNVRNLSFPLGETTTFPKKAPGLIPPRPAPAQSNPGASKRRQSKPRRPRHSLGPPSYIKRGQGPPIEGTPGRTHPRSDPRRVPKQVQKATQGALLAPKQSKEQAKAHPRSVLGPSYARRSQAP